MPNAHASSVAKKILFLMFKADSNKRPGNTKMGSCFKSIKKSNTKGLIF